MAFTICDILDLGSACKWMKNLCWGVIFIFILGYVGKGIYSFAGTVACCFTNQVNNCLLGKTEETCESLGGDSRPITSWDVITHKEFWTPDGVFWLWGISLLLLIIILLIIIRLLGISIDKALKYLFCEIICKRYNYCYCDCCDDEIVNFHKDYKNMMLRVDNDLTLLPM